MMKKMPLIAVFIVLGTTMLAAQKGNNGWGQNSKYGRMFDVNTVEVFNATVHAVEKITPNNGMRYGIHLKVLNGKEVISVHLGPAWYIDNQDLQLSKGDKIMVTGSRIIFEKYPAIIAIEIEKNGNVLQLRNSDGYPRWNAWRKKGMGRKGIQK